MLVVIAAERFLPQSHSVTDSLVRMGERSTYRHDDIQEGTEMRRAARGSVLGRDRQSAGDEPTHSAGVPPGG